MKIQFTTIVKCTKQILVTLPANMWREGNIILQPSEALNQTPPDRVIIKH